MSSLPITTKHRITRIPQIPHVWEGDIFPIGEMIDNLEPELRENGQCIVWVDGSEGFIRTMDVVRGNTGPEAIVRALLKAIEKPQSPAEPARPHKVVVRDRQLQFFLRGALQGLDIDVDYQGELPLLDELWNNLQAVAPRKVGNIPSTLLEKLEERAIALMWEQAPWTFLAEYNLIEIKIDAYNVESLYACIMGMMGQEFGIIFYRSLDSMKKFRLMAKEVSDDAMEEGDIERAFLQQDCWFLNFSIDDQDFDENELWHDFFFSNMENEFPLQVIFGSIHPYEGIRPLVDAEELDPLYLAIEALGKFIQKNKKHLEKNLNQEIAHQYSIKLPWEDHKPHPVKVRTMPEVTAELEAIEGEVMEDDWEIDDEDDQSFNLSEDLFGNTGIVCFCSFSEDLLKSVEAKSSTWVDKRDLIFNKKNKSQIPVITVQTTRPKGKLIIEQLKEEKGIEYILFTLGKDYFNEETFDIAIIKTFAGFHHIFGEFERGESSFYDTLQKWKKRIRPWQGKCGFAIAMGSTGANKGRPRERDILGFFETKLVTPEELGFEELVLSLDSDFS